jgi:anthranilate/para-aminobenzoate synthase component I
MVSDGLALSGVMVEASDVVVTLPERETDPNIPTNVAKRLIREIEKERTENLMIVDLVRNDMSKISKKGTVKVSNLFEIQSFETVHQMVSTGEAEVNEGVNSVEILKACFPMGSMTGAPKVSALKITLKVLIFHWALVLACSSMS